MSRPRANRVHRPRFLQPSERARQERMAKVREKRDPVINAMYSCTQWKELRASVLREANYICASYRCPQRAVIVDHIKPHRGEAPAFFDRANLQPLCKRHHDIKTARRDGGFGNPRRDVSTRTPDSDRDAAPGTASRGPQNVGGISRFSGARRTARLSSFFRTQPFQENGTPREKHDSGRDAGAPRVTRLTTLLGPPGASTGPGAGAANHPPAPGVPVIRNRVTK